MISSGAEMSGSYDPLQVALSVLIAISASYAALDPEDRARVEKANGKVLAVNLLG